MLLRVVFFDMYFIVFFFRYIEVVEDILILLIRMVMVIDFRFVSLKDKLVVMRVVC